MLPAPLPVHHFPPTPLARRHWQARTLTWLGEIVVVFVGVYSAFLLNSWQLQRQDRLAHLQILQSLDEQLSVSVPQSKNVAEEVRKDFDKFHQQIAAGEMPALHLITFSTDYDPSDDVALSQAGADHLLNFKTVEALKKMSSVERQGLMMLHDYQQLSNELLAPRLDDPKETFYNPQTKQLRPMFQWYQSAGQEANQFTHDYAAASDALLTRVRAERAALR